jgi:hypothetical protein
MCNRLRLSTDIISLLTYLLRQCVLALLLELAFSSSMSSALRGKAKLLATCGLSNDGLYYYCIHPPIISDSPEDMTSSIHYHGEQVFGSRMYKWTQA